MRPGVCIALVVTLVALTGCGDSTSPEPPPRAKYEVPPGEKPIFQVDADARGQLTMDELQLSIPKRIAERLTSEQARCVYREVRLLADAAGDPRTLDPADVTFLADNDPADWHALKPHPKRVILAQAIVSEAFQICG